MIRSLLPLLAVALVALPAFADDKRASAEPDELIHVPIEEMDVLLKSGKKGIVVRYAEYKRLLDAATKRRDAMASEPPIDGALVSVDGILELSDPSAGRMELSYDVRVVADGPRSVPFPLRGFAIESLRFTGGEGLFEERSGRPRLFFEGAGTRGVRVMASAQYARKGTSRLLDMHLPPAGAMGLTLRLPAGFDAIVNGEGPEVRVPAQAAPHELRVRPHRSGRLLIAMAPAAKGIEGPPILDSQVHGVHTIADGMIRSDVVVQTDVLRTAVRTIALTVPAEFAIHDLSGDAVTGFRRTGDRTRIEVDFSKPMWGRVGLKLNGELPYAPGPGVVPPSVRVTEAIRHRRVVGVRVGPDVKLRDVTPTGGRRVPAGKGQQGLFLYALAGADAQLDVTLEAGATRTEAVSTYYLNLGEAGKTLLATTTYRVVDGTVFKLQPTFPQGFELRDLTINGQVAGFARELRPDGTLEIRLGRGVPAGGEIAMAATLEQAGAEWLPDGPATSIALPIPSAGAEHQEGLVAVGADATYRVLEGTREDLVPVGAGELTAQGIAAAGLVYGYRLDGEDPALTLSVQRREPLLEADVITALVPTPRRLEVSAMVVHRIERAGVRRVFVDVPAWAGKEVRFMGRAIRAWHRLEGDDAPQDVRAGFARWQVDLDRRVIGRHVMLIGYHDDQDDPNWSISVERPVCARVPLKRSQRMLVVRRAQGLEVTTQLPDSADVRRLDVSELPAEATVNPLEVLDVVRLANGADGIGLAVHKHDGAAVLNAIATQVAIATAVANEGVLRTRCHVSLFNVDRQFLELTLPANSELIGAVVDAKPVKPLVKGDGTILLPIPTARGSDARVVAAFTYETQLGGELSGEVEIAGPRFTNLEVLQTTHRVAFEPGLAIDAVEGSFSGRGLRVDRPRSPLIASLRISGGAAASGEVLDVTSAGDAGPFLESSNGRAGEGISFDRETDNDLPYDESFGQTEGKMDAPFDGAPRMATPRGDDAKGGEQKPGDRANHTPRASASTGERPAQPGRPMPATPGGAPLPAVNPDGPVADPGDPPPGEEDAEFENRDGGEGGVSPRRGTQPRRVRAGARRKGLLSLDVPVLLSPNVVVAHRLGSGGLMTIHVSDPESEEQGWLALLLLFTAGGLLVSRFGRGARWGATLGLGALALLVHLVLGAPGATLACALLDAATVLVVLHALVALGRWMLGTPAAAAAMLLAAISLTVLAPAAQADEPRAPTPKVKEERKIYVPYDPSKKTDPEQHDKVFLPLETYLELYKAAHPEADPDVVRLGRYVTLVDAAYQLALTSGYAEGTLKFELAKRGEGLKLVGLPIGGMAITSATLDGQPVRLLLDRGLYRVPVERMGRHQLTLTVRAPVVQMTDRRRIGVRVPSFAGAQLTVGARDFRGTMEVNSAGRVQQGDPEAAGGWEGVAALGRTHKVTIDLVDPKPDSLPTTIVTRSTSQTIFSLREDGTEVDARITAHILQGLAPFLDIALAEGATLLGASGKDVVRWEARSPQVVRVYFTKPRMGEVPLRVRAFVSSARLERTERLDAPQLVGATGENGRITVNMDPTARVDVTSAAGLYRAARPRTKEAHGPDGRGRVLGAWTFAARPAVLGVSVSRAAPRIESESTVAVVFGDDRVRTRLDALVDVDPGRTPVGHLIFDLPGADAVRTVESSGLSDWWTVGTGPERALHLRYAQVRSGKIAVRVRLERRLGGMTDGIAVPRWRLRGASSDKGRLTLYSLPDVEPSAGTLPGLVPVALERAAPPPSFVPRSNAVHAFAWDRPLDDSLIVVLRKPDLELRAVTISQIAPSDEEHRLETLALFDVRRGATDRLRIFVPDGGRAAANVVRARDVREIREQPVTRKAPNGDDVRGTLYDLTLQSPRGGLIEVALSQVWRAGGAVHLPQPEEVQDRRWYSLVRSFVDGSVVVAPGGGRVEEAVWADLPFVPTGLSPSNVVKLHESREPYVLDVEATRHDLDEQSAAVVLATTIDAVVGRDGYARIRANYRVFNRARQFLRLRLPDGAALYGASASGRAIKPLHGAGNTVLLPVPKVPVGGAGYNVTIAYRTRSGEMLDAGKALKLTFPEVPGVEVDRTVVRLFVPEGYRYDFESGMTAVEEAAVAADLAEAAIREARNLLKVTETGNLEQRRASAHNARRLIEEAKRLSTSREVTKVRPELGVQVKQVAEICAFACTKVDQDVAAAQGQVLAVNPSELEFAGNAAQLIELQEQQNDAPEETVAPTNRAGWRFNNDAPQTGGEGKKANIQLKNQIEGELRSRRSLENQKRRASRAAAAEKRANAAQAKPRSDELLEEIQSQHTTGTRGKGRQTEQLKNQAQDRFMRREATRGYDTRNFEELNRRLKQSWVDNGQLGAENGLSPEANGLVNDDGVSGFGFTSFGQTRFADKDGDTFFTDRIPPFVDGQNETYRVDQYASVGRASPHSLWYSRSRRDGQADELIGYTSLYNSRFQADSGVYFNDGADGDFRGRASNKLDFRFSESARADDVAQDLGNYEPADMTGGGGGGYSVSGKAGLMGVDVPLPAVGKVYYFRSLRGGSTIEIEADKDEVSMFGRVVILLLILGGLGVLAFGVRRRLRARA